MTAPIVSEKTFGPFSFLRTRWALDALGPARVTYQVVVQLSARTSVQLFVLRFDEP